MKRKLFVIIGFLLIFSSLFIHNVTALTSKELALGTNLIGVGHAYNKRVKSEFQTVTVQVKQYDPEQDKHAKDSLITISLEEAKQVKEKFLSVEKDCSGAEKIKEQLKIMHEIGVISSNFTLDKLVAITKKTDHSHYSSFFNIAPSVIVDGPMIISHFTLGGRIHGFSFKPWYYQRVTREINGLFNRSYIDGVVGALPIFIGFSFKPVYITAFSYNGPRSYNHLFFPFIEALIPCVGTSVAFVVDTGHSSPVILFEYNLDVCLVGALGGVAI